MVGRPAHPPEDRANALGGRANCISFAAAARRKSRYVYSRPSAARAALFRDPAAGVIVLRTHEMRLRFGIENRVETPAAEPAEERD